MSYDKRELMRDIGKLHLVRESMYGHLPEAAHEPRMIDASRVIVDDILRIIAFGASARTREDDAALIGGICDELLFVLQETARLV